MDLSAVHWVHGDKAAWVALAWAVLVGTGAWALVRGQRRQRAVIAQVAEARMWGVAAPAGAWLRWTVWALALGCLAVAVLRPQRKLPSVVERRGLDLVVALDVSKSMMVDDLGRPRLVAARALALQLIAELPGDRIAPVVFAGAAAHFPLTEDHTVARQFLTDLGPADIAPGSDLEGAMRLSRCLLRPDLFASLGCDAMIRRGNGGAPLPEERDQDAREAAAAAADPEVEAELEERGKAIVLFTDGADEATAARAEADAARQLGVAVFVIGIGTEAGGPVFDINAQGQRTTPKVDDAGQRIVSRLDVAGLTAIAEAAGDAKRFMRVADDGSFDVADLTRALAQVKRGLSRGKRTQLRDVEAWWVFAALCLLVLEALVPKTRRARPVAPGAGQARLDA